LKSNPKGRDEKKIIKKDSNKINCNKKKLTRFDIKIKKKQENSQF
jgi:hypothetical protein